MEGFLIVIGILFGCIVMPWSDDREDRKKRERILKLRLNRKLTKARGRSSWAA